MLRVSLVVALLLSACAPTPKTTKPAWTPPATIDTTPVDFGSTPEAAYNETNAIIRAYAADARRCELLIRAGGRFSDADKTACYRAIEARTDGSRGDQALKQLIALGKQPLSPTLTTKVNQLLPVATKLVEQSRIAFEYFNTRSR